jgi:CIC family chloride channel protein
MNALRFRARRLRAILAERVPVPPLLLWATVVGVMGALATIAFRDALTGLEWLLAGRSGSLVELSRSLPWQARLAFPTLGGAAAGAILALARRHAPAGGADYMAAIAYHDGAVAVRHSLLTSSSSLVTIASGGSIGREGPMVQLAAMCASVIARRLRVPAGHVRVLVACGAAAGITAAYNAPIASAFFVSEIVLGSIVMESFGPIVVAAVVANITMREFPGYRPTYEMPPIPAAPLPELGAFIVLRPGGIARSPVPAAAPVDAKRRRRPRAAASGCHGARRTRSGSHFGMVPAGVG